MILELSIVNSSKSVFTILCLMKFCLPSNCLSARTVKAFPDTDSDKVVGIEKFLVGVVTHQGDPTSIFGKYLLGGRFEI